MEVTVKQLFEAGVHFGHRTCFRRPEMMPYIYGVRNGISIIDLDKTRKCIKEALNYISKVASSPGSKILFVGTKNVAVDIIQEQAIRCGMPYINHRWLGGLLTNYRTVRKSMSRLTGLETQSQDGSFDQLTKKEALNLQREMNKLERSFGGIKDMNGLPDALFVIDRGYEHIAVSEAQKLKIPLISVVDSNHSPDGIDYVIPGNDDATRAVALYAQLVSDTILEARSAALKPADLAIPETEKADALEVQSKVPERPPSLDEKGE